MNDGVGGLEAERDEAGQKPGRERPHGLRDWMTAGMHARLAAYAQRFLRDEGEAEDIAQETLMRAREGLDLLRDPARFEAWLFRICRHAAIDRVRARRVRQRLWVTLVDGLGELAGPDLSPPLTGEGDLAADAPPRDRPRGGSPLGGPSVGGSDAQGRRRLFPGGWRGLALPAHQRVLVRLHYERGCPQTRLCHLSGLSASALRVRLFRARGALAQAGAQSRAQAGAQAGAQTGAQTGAQAGGSTEPGVER